MIEFIVPGEAVGKQRPKGSSVGGFVRMYTPKKTVNYESLVQNCFLDKFTIQDMIRKPNGVEVRIKIFHAIPKSYSKKKVQAILNGEFPLITKPDIDNVAKSILDGLNGFAYEDDSQVDSLTVEKFYTPSEPKAVVQVEEQERVKLYRKILLAIKRGFIKIISRN